MVSKVAVVKTTKNLQASLHHAFKLIGGIDDLNTPERQVVIKPGIFDHRKNTHPTVGLVGAIASCFNRAPKTLLAESDNYRGLASERLDIYKEIFNQQVLPFNLSEDSNTRGILIGNEKISLSHILFKPSVFVSTHLLRKYSKGTILKNLLGLIPDRKKVRFHKNLVTVLLDAYKVIGGIDLAVLDATHIRSGRHTVDANIIVVGRDAVAVEAVGATLVGMKPKKMPIIKEAMNRGYGEGRIDEIDVCGIPIEGLAEEIHQQVVQLRSSS